MSQVIDATGVTADDVAAIRTVIDPWIDACLGRNWDALLSLCTEQVAFLPPNELPVQGGEVRPWLDRFPIVKTMSFDFNRIEGSADLACATGWVQMTLEVSGQQIAFDGKFTDLFRKQADGSWRAALVMWSSNHPA